MATRTFTGPQNGRFGDATNWSPNDSAPIANDTAVIANTTVTFPSGGGLIGTYTVAPAVTFDAPWAVPAEPRPGERQNVNGVAFIAGFQHEPNLDAAV